MQPEYVTIKRFSELCGCTTQNVYKKLKTDLQPYINSSGGVKTISTEALKLFNIHDPQPLPTAPTIQPDEPIILLKYQLDTQTQKIDDMEKKLDQQTELIKELVKLVTDNQPQDQPEPKQLSPPEIKKPWWKFW